MKAPFPYFGGKARVAPLIWQALGDCGHYIEPFFGSGAVLLARPGWDRDQPRRWTETINDADGFVANVWRALQFDPDAVAKQCDWPVNHADLIARKAALIRDENWLLENLCKDDKWFDAELAGYWIWAASCWIGSGLTSPGQRPHLSANGMGVHAVGQRPHLGDKGMGVREPYNTNIYDWFRTLSERLRYVRVVCGDWSRVCGGNWQDRSWSTVGMFFDPPYAVNDRNNGIYHKESLSVAHDVRSWCIERGDRENYRIVIAGYDEHEELADHGWSSQDWKAGGGYANTARNNGDSRGKQNRKREMLWFSPHCITENVLV